MKNKSSSSQVRAPNYSNASGREPISDKDLVRGFLLDLGASALSEDPADAPIEAPTEPAREDHAFEDGDMGKIDGCKGEIYSTHEAAAEAAEAKGTSFHEHQEAGTTYYMLS